MLDYPTARAGTAVATSSGATPSASATTRSRPSPPTEETLYVVQHGSSGGATYKVSTITGTPAAPAFNVPGAFKTRPGGGWSQPVGDMLPQQCIAATPPDADLPAKRAGSTRATRRCARTPSSATAGFTTRRPSPCRPGPARRPTPSTTRFRSPTARPRSGQCSTRRPATTSTAGASRTRRPRPRTAASGTPTPRSPSTRTATSCWASPSSSRTTSPTRATRSGSGRTRPARCATRSSTRRARTTTRSSSRGRGTAGATTATRSSTPSTTATCGRCRSTRGARGRDVGSNDSRWGTWWAKVDGAGRHGRPPHLGVPPVRPQRTRGLARPRAERGRVHRDLQQQRLAAHRRHRRRLGRLRSWRPRTASRAAPSRAGTVIPARGHFLCANSDGYSSGRPPGRATATTATPDADLHRQHPEQHGRRPLQHVEHGQLLDRDAARRRRPASEANALYREGTGYPALTQFLINHSFYRDNCGKGGSITIARRVPDRRLAEGHEQQRRGLRLRGDERHASAGAGQRLGAPGPENLSSPVQRNSQLAAGNIDPSVGSSNAPNRVRDFTSRPAKQLDLRHAADSQDDHEQHGGYRHAAALPRHRPDDVPCALGLRRPARAHFELTPSVPAVVTISGTNAACPANICTVQQTTLEQPPAQPNGGAFNSTLSVGSVTLAERRPGRRLGQRPVPARHPADGHVQVLHQHRDVPLRRARRRVNLRQRARGIEHPASP